MEIEIYENYRDNEELRNLFFEFTPKALYGADFRKWYEMGCWSDKYKAFSIIKDGRMVSNVSVSEIDIYQKNSRQKALQFATVGTLPKYRNRGYSRHLMNYVLKKYEEKVDLFYLFANETVIDFYPKFGFERKFEVLFKSFRQPEETKYAMRSLNLDEKRDLDIIQNLLMNRNCLTESFSPINYDFITMWHIIYIYSKNLYYFEEKNIIFILESKEKSLHIYDIISEENFELDSIFNKIIQNSEIEEIYYYFTPNQIGINSHETVPDEDSLFFIRGDFSLKNRTFKYPITGQT